MTLREHLYLSYLRTPHHSGKLRFVGWLERMLLVPRDVQALTSFDMQMRLCRADFVQFQILLNGHYEPLTLARLKLLLEGATTFVDVGAHVGQYTLLASKSLGASGKVISIEPNPRTFGYLRQNLLANQCANVTAILAAVSDRAEIAAMQWPPEFNWGLSAQSAPNCDQEAGRYFVPAIRLGQLLDEFGIRTPDVIKIDVEGHELDVLAGLLEGRAEGNAPSHIVLEHYPAHERSVAALRYLQIHGYEAFDVLGNPFLADRDPPENNVWVRRHV